RAAVRLLLPPSANRAAEAVRRRASRRPRVARAIPPGSAAPATPAASRATQPAAVRTMRVRPPPSAAKKAGPPTAAERVILLEPRLRPVLAHQTSRQDVLPRERAIRPAAPRLAAPPR